MITQIPRELATLQWQCWMLDPTRYDVKNRSSRVAIRRGLSLCDFLQFVQSLSMSKSYECCASCFLSTIRQHQGIDVNNCQPFTMKFYIAFLFWVAAAPASYAQSRKDASMKAKTSKAPAMAKAKATKAPKDASMKATKTKAPAKAKANKAVFNL